MPSNYCIMKEVVYWVLTPAKLTREELCFPQIRLLYRQLSVDYILLAPDTGVLV